MVLKTENKNSVAYLKDFVHYWRYFNNHMAKARPGRARLESGGRSFMQVSHTSKANP